MKGHLIAFAPVALGLAISGAAHAQQAITPDQLVGVWKLQSQVFHDASSGKDTTGPLSIGYVTLVRQGKNSQDLGRLLRNQTGNKRARMLPTRRPLNCSSRMLRTREFFELGSTATAEGTPATTTIDVDMEPAGIGPHPRTYVLSGTKLTVIVKEGPTTTLTSVFEKVE